MFKPKNLHVKGENIIVITDITGSAISIDTNNTNDIIGFLNDFKQQLDDIHLLLQTNSQQVQVAKVLSFFEQNKLYNPCLSDPISEEWYKFPNNIPYISHLIGRTQKLDELSSKLFENKINSNEMAGCTVGIIGPPGIGKTALVSKFLHQFHNNIKPFKAVIWESLRADPASQNPPYFHSIANSLLLKLSNGKISSSILSTDEYKEKTERIVLLLKKQPFLIVFDNFESVLNAGTAERVGYFSENCWDYAWLIKSLIESNHKSKIIIISRENFSEVSKITYKTIKLRGLTYQNTINFIKHLGLIASDKESGELGLRYKGHPKALEVIAALIKDDTKFNGNVVKFLKDRDWLLTIDIENIINEIIKRLSQIERKCWLRISVFQTDEYPLTIDGIAAQVPDIDEYDLQEVVVTALERRQLLDYNPLRQSYQLHPLFQEKAYRLLSDINNKELFFSHKKAYEFFMSLPLKSALDWNNIEDIKPKLMAFYHVCKFRDWDTAASIICEENIRRALVKWGDFRLVLKFYGELMSVSWEQSKEKIASSLNYLIALNLLGIAYRNLYDFNNSILSYKAALEIAKKIGDRKWESIVLGNLAHVYNNTESYEKAIECAIVAIDLSKK